MFPYARVTLLLLLAAELRWSCSTEVKVENDAKKLCLYANLMVNFTVTYDTLDSKNATVTFALPDTVNSTGSSCGNDSSTMMLRFGEGHSWSLNFTHNNESYTVDSISLTYNLSDESIFKNASSNDTRSVSVKQPMEPVGLDTYYSCKSQMTYSQGSVLQALWNVSIQAFIDNGTLSKNVTNCPADLPTSTTTQTTLTTTVKPTSSPTPTPQPSTGTYRVNSSGGVCVMAKLGLQLRYKAGSDFQSVNLNPNGTTADGMCGTNVSDAILLLKSEEMNVSFSFSQHDNKFFLHAVNVTVLTSSGLVQEVATNLSLWETFLGSSYMCNKQQSFNVSKTLLMFTYNLQVQPFQLKNGTFSTAHQCPLDDSSILIPIIVGAVLAGLIIIVLIAYVIGRRKTYVGYQTL